MKQYFTFFMSTLLLFSAQVLSAQTWTGAANSNWNNPANWSTLAVPTATGNVEIVFGPNKPVILAGTAAVAKSVFVEIGSELTINAGASLSINGATNIGFFNLGTVTNDGTINIGNVSSITNVGLQNDGIFKNTSKIRIGDVATVGKNGILSNGTFENTTANGEIHINRTSEVALKVNYGTFKNEAKIQIGVTAIVGDYGIQNKATFENKTGGDIQIDRTSYTGLYNEAGTFSNAAKITVGAFNSPGYAGIITYGDFYNTGMGEINIDRATLGGLYNYSGLFSNAAKIRIGAVALTGQSGAYNTGNFENKTGGEIQIDRTTQVALAGAGGSFTNAAKIKIGSIASIGNVGIGNNAPFTNNLGGDIQIDRVVEYCIQHYSGNFINYDKITIGGNAAGGIAGIYNEGDFFNNSNGDIKIDRFSNAGFVNFTGSSCSNTAKITIGSVASVGDYGIQNKATFENKTGGDIQIDRSIKSGLFNEMGNFGNAAKITIGSIASVGSLGIENKALFTNKLGGDIQIDRSLGYGIYLWSGDFINLDKITIGSIATVGFAGIFNRAAFFNNTNGDIKIDRFSISGFINFTGSCSNTAKITIGAATVGGQYSVTNNATATFVNSTCAILSVFAAVNNEGTFYQNGLLSVITPNQHMNTGSFGNNGIIVYPYGNPIPNVTNYDIIVLPISSNCGGTITNALQLGVDNDYVVNTTWYKDAAMTLPGGTYNQATNIFTLTSLSAPLFISIQSYAGGCTRRVPIFITTNDNIPPTITCPANIVRNTDPNQCYATVTYTTPTATDNCAAPTVAIVPPSLASGAQFPKGVNSVTWQATDGAGLTHRCTFTVTVNGGAGSFNITCPANQIKSTDLDQCSAVVTYVTPTSVDNCGGGSSPVVTWVSGGTTPTASGANSISTFQKGVTTVQWKATDVSNTTKTCTFKVTINDTQLPSITCPANQTLTTTGNSCASANFNYVVTATDNCMPAPTVIRTNGLPSGSSFPKGTSNVTWRALDGAGNSKTCSFSVTVADNVLPTITCPTNVAVTAAPGQCSATAFYSNPTATDNCEVQSMYLMSGLASGSMYPQGVTNNVWVATDNSGQSATCAFTVTVTCGSGYGSVINDRAINDDIQGANSEITMRLSPNPAITSVAVALEGLGATGGELIVMDAQGKSVWQQILTNTSVVEQISVSEFTAGIYFVMLRSDRGVVTKRLVVSRD